MLNDIALTLIPGLGTKGTIRLLEVFSTADKIFQASFEELVHFAKLNPTVAQAIVGRTTFAQAQRELEHCRRHSITPIASTDELYPPLLLDTPDYPHVLYVMGNPSALLGRNVSVVGTRRISSYGDRMCYDMVRELSLKVPNLSIISGLAFGVDSSAHRAALHNGVPTVAVLANSLPSITPPQHSSLARDIIDRGGAIVSEYHSQTKQNGKLYIARNRIVAALSGVTVVVESPLAGGSMATAAIANSYNRLVMALPGRLIDTTSAGCNMLIRNNQAQIFLSADGLVREMMWDSLAPTDRVVATSLAADLAPELNAILSLFGSSSDPLSLEDLLSLSGLPTSELSIKLMELELQGVIRLLPGNRYERLDVVVAR